MPEWFIDVCKQNIGTFGLYFGASLLPLLYVFALAYCLIKEKRAWIKIVLLTCPLLLLCAFLFPFTRLFYLKFIDEQATYYRILWLLPVGATVSYAFTALFRLKKAKGLILSILFISLLGSLVYKSPHITKASNPYHLNREVIDVCDAILENGEDRVDACVPVEFVHQVRQYTTKIVLVMGRDAVEPSWNYYNEIYPLVTSEKIDFDELFPVLESVACNCLVLHESKEIEGDESDYDWKYVKNVSGYDIYRKIEVKE